MKGDMSFVGPRPALYNQYNLIEMRKTKRIHKLTPGLTGWAQINGRNSLTWDEKFSLDIWYVDNQSLWLDIKIIFQTVLKVLDKSGIDDGLGVGQEKFKGNHK
jgi:sugar transferase EpsL